MTLVASPGCHLGLLQAVKALPDGRSQAMVTLSLAPSRLPDMARDAGLDGAGVAGIDDAEAGALAGGVDQRQVGVDAQAEVEHAGHEQEEDGQDDGELDERLATAALALVRGACDLARVASEVAVLVVRIAFLRLAP